MLIDSFKWNNDNHSCDILNVDGSCLGTPRELVFVESFETTQDFIYQVFSVFINDASDISYPELYAIYHGLIWEKTVDIIELICYTDFLHCINLLKGPTMRLQVYAVLIQDVKDFIEQSNVIVSDTLRENNHCADFFAKLGASSDNKLLYHASPPADLFNLFKMDEARTFYFRE
jgi:hypothetical protein